MKRRSCDTVLPATCHGLCLLIILSVIITTCTGFEIFFPVSTIKLVVPTSSKTLGQLSKLPIAHLQIESINKSIEKFMYIYRLENPDEILEINGRTGEIFIGKNFHKLDKATTFIITAQNLRQSKQNVARTSLEIVPYSETNQDFCSNLENVCFWDSVAYSIAEDKKEMHFESKKIGELGPNSYRFLCPQYDITYQLNNNSAYVRVKGNVLYTNEHFDHDSFRPGPTLDVSVLCFVQKSPNSLPQTVEKGIKIAILDRNDNGPTLQETEGEQMTFRLDDPHLIKDKSIGSKIIFLDQDSLPVNSRIIYEIHNDTFEILKPICNGYVADHMGLKTSVISCQLHLARDGILRRSPYCVILEAYDESVDSDDPKSAQMKICLETDLSLIHESDRPTALALHSVPAPSERRRGRGRKDRKLVLSSDESLSSSESNQRLQKPIPISFPHDVYVYRTARNLSRVSQPDRMIELINRTIVRFKIINDPTHSFNITKTAGIIYVSNETALKTAPETIYYLTISWQTGSCDIIIHLEDNRPVNTTCDQLDSSLPTPSCSEVGSKKECSHLCGTGTNGGACSFRENNNIPGISFHYATCSPDLRYCPDNVCDPLEELGQKYDRFICPQDCSPSTDIFGPHTPNDNSRGIYAGLGICTCDHFGKCGCAAHYTTPSKFKKPNKKKFDLASNRTEMGSLLTVTSTDESNAFKCGPSCLMLIIGCPVILLVLVIGLYISRRKYVRQAKRKTIADRVIGNGFDNETRNDMPLVSMDGDFKLDNTIDTKWEFPREHLLLDVILGEGEFGKVVKAFATNIADRPGITTVAVKMLKSGSNSVEHLALLSEFQLLQEVCHPNVIKLLGACTKGDTPFLIIEYALYGSLRNYLRLSRKIECSGIEFTNGVEQVTVKDILSFAWQICKGMAYLTEIKLVHRDLAARNVLLAEGKICKVSDFGLTRDVYEDDAYLKRSKDRVPVKWMAPESLADHVYTTKSDVWAFGILAWELITLGASPYPGIPPQNLYHLLKTGYRMERPENCSEDIYSIVRSCWTDDPSSRPSFKYLASQWEKLLGNNAKYIELEANAISNPLYCQEDTKSDTFEEALGEPDSLDHLWRAPQSSDIIEHSTSLDQCSQCTEHFNVPPGYDMPRPLIETKTTEQNLRYENDLRFPLNIRGSRISQPLDPNHYSVPKRGKSYMDMTTKNLISDNLDNEDIEKRLSKNLSFRFSSLLNLKDQQTSVV